MEIPPTLLKCCIIGESNWESWENILFLSWSWTEPAIFSIALVRCNLQQLSCEWCLHSCRDLSSPHLRFYPLPAGRVCLFTGLYLVAQIYKFWNPRFTINKTNSYKTLAIIWMCKSHKSFMFGSNRSSISCKYMRRCCIDTIRASPLQDVTDHCKLCSVPRVLADWWRCEASAGSVQTPPRPARATQREFLAYNCLMVIDLHTGSEPWSSRCLRGENHFPR